MYSTFELPDLPATLGLEPRRAFYLFPTFFSPPIPPRWKSPLGPGTPRRFSFQGKHHLSLGSFLLFGSFGGLLAVVLPVILRNDLRVCEVWARAPDFEPSLFLYHILLARELFRIVPRGFPPRRGILSGRGPAPFFLPSLQTCDPASPLDRPRWDFPVV